MFEKKIPLFSLFGFKVGIDITWFVLVVLITWSLAKGMFPRYFAGFSNTTYWLMGAAGALGLFVSIIFHEFCHSLVARQFNLPVKGITLFIFGGVAEMSKEPENAKSEFFMAITGPISSAVLAGIFFLSYTAGKAVNSPETDSIDALSLMNSTGNSRLMVVEGNRLLGVISLKDMLQFMALKLDLEAGHRRATGPNMFGN